jgi:putative FmdB family regulatory protein
VPTYDYQCRECGHVIEIIHSILEDGPEACERCRGPVMRVLHPSGVIFRGSGFYVTDSRASGGDSSQSSDSGTDGKSKDGGPDSAAPKTETKKDATGSTGSSGGD